MGPDVAFYLIVMKGMQLAKGLQVLSANLSAFFSSFSCFFQFFYLEISIYSFRQLKLPKVHKIQCLCVFNFITCMFVFF